MLGDQTVAQAGSGSTVTWWGGSWSQVNALSDGAAPASFKGFAGILLPDGGLTCGGTFQSRPGNSDQPPAQVPAYMAVAVASTVTKSGGTISKIVVAKTDSGYAAAPGHPGTGTIVGTICG